MAGIRKFFDNLTLAVFAAIVVAFGNGLAGGQAVAATLSPPGFGESQILFKVEPGESFSQQAIIGVGTNEVRLGGFGVGFPTIRGFGPATVVVEASKAPVVILKSVTSQGVPTNGNYRVIVTAPQTPGRYKLEFRSYRADGRPGWRSDVWYEVVAKNSDDDTGTDAQSSDSPAPRFGGMDAAPPIRVSTRLEGIRTLGQEPKSTSPDSIRGEIVAAMRIAPETDLRGKLIGNKSDPDPTASDYSWGQNAGAGIGIGRQVGEVYIAMDGEITPDLSFKEDDLWGKTPLVLLASAESTKWHYGWLKSEGFLALSTRHAGARGVGKLKIAGDGVNSHLAIALGGHGNKGWTTGAAYGQYLFGFETGLRTDLGYATIGALAGAGDSEPMSALGTLTIRN